MSRLIMFLMCAVAMPSAFAAQATLDVAEDGTELTRTARTLSAIRETECRVAGTVRPYQTCGGRGRRTQCCPLHKGVHQVCTVISSRTFKCQSKPNRSKTTIRQSWKGGSGGGRVVKKTKKVAKKTVRKPAVKRNTKPKQASRSSLVFDTGLGVDVGRFTASGGGFSTQGSTRSALSTFFNGVGSPFSGCGVMPQDLRDDNGKPLPFVALNFQDTSISAPFVQPASNSNMGAFENGKHCGRWIKITAGGNCKNGGNSDQAVCSGGSYQNDGISGQVMYGVIADSCGDNNYWCRSDTQHLDISAPYLDSLGVKGGWNGRQVDWQFIDAVPPGWSMNDGPKMAWKSNSKWIRNGGGFYADIIIWNLGNGIGGVDQDMGGGNWKALATNEWLGQQFRLEQPESNEYRSYNGGGTRSFNLRIRDYDGKLYGTYRVVMNCNDNDSCRDNTRAPVIRL